MLILKKIMLNKKIDNKVMLNKKIDKQIRKLKIKN